MYCCLWLLDIRAVSTKAEFLPSGGFIELPQSLFRHDRDGVDTIEMTVVTQQLSGLLLWQGQTSSRSHSKDFIALAFENGRVHFRFPLLICHLHCIVKSLKFPVFKPKFVKIFKNISGTSLRRPAF